jgi:hypothetical protein
MEIKEIKLYKLEGKTYNSLKEIKIEVENRIGAIIDTMSIPVHQIGSAQRLHIFQILTNPENREKLQKLLNVTYEQEIGGYNYNPLHSSETKNILDL